MKVFHLLLFPILQTLFFLAGIRMISAERFVAASILILIAALFLNFTLHVSIHYHVHFKSRSNLLNRSIDLITSLIMGIPFHYYQMSHWNHHKYHNRLSDFTSTWKKVNDVPVPRNFLMYSFFWPFMSSQSLSDQLQHATDEGYFNREKKWKMNSEAILILLFYISLSMYSILFMTGYLVMVYTGWVFIAMHNYGQHLPENYGVLNANSYYHSLYNALSINNGLHLEHHTHPQQKYWELTQSHEGKIQRPHVLEGFFFLLTHARRRRRRKGQPV